jgi:type I restriction enzyme M protein
MSNHNEISSFIWNVCDDVLRGLFKQHEYGDVILPFVVLRRLDCVLEGKKDDIIKVHQEYNDKFDDTSKIIHSKLNLKFSNYSRYDLRRLKDEPNKLSENFYDYLSSFSTNVQDIIKNFGLQKHIDKLESNNKLYILVEKFTDIDLHPSNVDNHVMGNIFEELLRRFSEMSNETSGEHYTPRDVVNLLVSLVFSPDKEKLSDPNKIISVYDPCCGTGGMLTIGKDWVHKNINNEVDVNLFGQELNPQTYSICKSDFLITDEEPDNIKLGSTLTNDQHSDGNRKFDYMITNPPFGVSWKSEQKQIKNESEEYGGRFSVGTPRVSDGSLLFLQHLISKMETQGSRIGIVFNGSPLFSGDSGSGESEIRKWIIENDWLECIVSLPNNLFFNTGITTYIWIVTNKKNSKRKGKVQLINCESFFRVMRKKLGEKRKEIGKSDREKILHLYNQFEENEFCKIFDNDFFGYNKIYIEQPKVENGIVVRDKKGNPKSDSKLKDFERVPLNHDIEEYYSREVKPHLPNSWINFDKTQKGYEINFTKYFYQYSPLRSSHEIVKDILELDSEIEGIQKQFLE